MTVTKTELQNTATTFQANSGVVQPKVINEEAQVALQQQSHKTVWGWDSGRPVYDRLPAITEQYQKAYKEDQLYVYLDPKLGVYDGPGSLQPVIFFDRPSVLAVNSGTITWKMGQHLAPGFEIDVSELEAGVGLPDGTYQVGYVMKYEIPVFESPVPGNIYAYLEDEDLGEGAVEIHVSNASEIHEGWQALNQLKVETSWWPGFTTDAGDYFPGSWAVLDFIDSVEAETFTLRTDPSEPFPTAKCALYWSDDGILWHHDNTVLPTARVYSVTTTEVDPHRFWKFFFWDGTCSISHILYRGFAYMPDHRVNKAIQTAVPYVGDLYEDPPENFILLSSFQIVNDQVGNLTDFRVFTSRKYEPVAKWVTADKDTHLRCMFDSVTNYSELFMSPITANYQIYEEMDNSECFGPGPITIGNQVSTYPLPHILEIECGFDSGDPQLCTRFLDSDPDSGLIEANLSPVDKTLEIDRISQCNTCQVVPKEIILLREPKEQSDLATKNYVDRKLYKSWSFDNGIYY